MEALINGKMPAGFPTDPLIPGELVPLIRKLRWMGMDDEVERVQQRLASCQTPLTDCVLAAPRETD